LGDAKLLPAQFLKALATPDIEGEPLGAFTQISLTRISWQRAIKQQRASLALNPGRRRTAKTNAAAPTPKSKFVSGSGTGGRFGLKIIWYRLGSTPGPSVNCGSAIALAEPFPSALASVAI
jgi:hypothetical protein